MHTIVPMTTDELTNLSIKYHFEINEENSFLNILIASTNKGICYIAFYNNKESAITELHNQFPSATFEKEKNNHFSIFSKETKSYILHVTGTVFQLKVWKALLNIPFGKLATYQELANQISQPKAHRAVGTAIGKNVIAFLIPCHRIIQSSGKLGNYKWSTEQKEKLIEWEK